MRLHFEENEFFEDKILEVSLEFDKNDEQRCQKVVGFPIVWKEGQDLTKKKIKKKQKNKKTGDTRTIVKTVESDSIFTMLSVTRTAPEMKDDEEPDSETEDLMMKIEDAQNFVEDMNDICLPDCLEYYLDMHDDDMEGMDDSDEEDEDGEGDDDDSDDDGKKKRKKSNVSGKSKESGDDSEDGGKKKKKGGKKGKKEEECKQQ
jgi:nucleosome assembly protein 1-like 1